MSQQVLACEKIPLETCFSRLTRNSSTRPQVYILLHNFIVNLHCSFRRTYKFLIFITFLWQIIVESSAPLSGVVMQTRSCGLINSKFSATPVSQPHFSFPTGKLKQRCKPQAKSHHRDRESWIIKCEFALLFCDCMCIAMNCRKMSRV